MEKNKLKKVVFRYGTLIFLIGLVVFFSTQNPNFLTWQNISNVLRQISIVGICSVGMTIVILTGGIDLSVGSVIALSSVSLASMLVSGVNVVLSIIITLVLGLIIGLINGFLINKLEIPPLITTLGTTTIFRGLAYIVTGGLSVYGFPKGFELIGQGYIGVIPIPVIIQVMAYALGFYLLYQTSFGRYVYGIGSNEKATYLSGISVKKVKYLVYMLSGFLGSVAGIVMLSRVNSGLPNTATGFELDVVTSVVLGGISVTGGDGHLSGPILGCLIIGVLSNGMILMGIEEYYQMLVKGVVLLGAVGLDIYMRKNLKEA